MVTINIQIKKKLLLIITDSSHLPPEPSDKRVVNKWNKIKKRNANYRYLNSRCISHVKRQNIDSSHTFFKRRLASSEQHLLAQTKIRVQI